MCVYFPNICIMFSEFMAIRNNFTEDRMLSRIHYFSCHDYQHLLATIQHLPEFLKEHENASMLFIIFDIGLMAFISTVWLLIYHSFFEKKWYCNVPVSGIEPRRKKTSFLAHLSRRLIGEFIVYQWSSVRRRPSVVVCRRSVVHNA